MSNIKSKYILDFFKTLNKENVQYMLIKNIGKELPHNLKDGKDIYSVCPHWEPMGAGNSAINFLNTNFGKKAKSNKLYTLMHVLNLCAKV